MGEGPAYLYLDNLRFHHGKEVEQKAREHEVQLVFAPIYSPTFNAIEGLWAHAKANFSKLMLHEERTDDQRRIRSLVQQAILATSSQYLERRVVQSLRLMKEEVQDSSEEYFELSEEH